MAEGCTCIVSGCFEQALYEDRHCHKHRREAEAYKQAHPYWRDLPGVTVEGTDYAGAAMIVCGLAAVTAGRVLQARRDTSKRLSRLDE